MNTFLYPLLYGLFSKSATVIFIEKRWRKSINFIPTIKLLVEVLRLVIHRHILILWNNPNWHTHPYTTWNQAYPIFSSRWVNHERMLGKKKNYKWGPICLRYFICKAVESKCLWDPYLLYESLKCAYNCEFNMWVSSGYVCVLSTHIENSVG